MERPFVISSQARDVMTPESSTSPAADPTDRCPGSLLRLGQSQPRILEYLSLDAGSVGYVGSSARAEVICEPLDLLDFQGRL